MIVVTGGAGFIGSNLVAGLNQQGEDNILVVDDLTEGTKFSNLSDLQIADYMDKDEFLARIEAGEDLGIDSILHQGACSTTTEWDGKYMMENNYRYSKQLLAYCQARQLPFLYASSASVYGGGGVFKEELAYETPLNVYGYSKFLFDQHVRRVLPKATAQIVGFRYFNVYGPRESHKGSMASVAFHFNNQLAESGECRLFAGSDGYADGEQRRDFVYVEDVVKVNLWFLQQSRTSGIFNLGTGRCQSFNDVADAVIDWHKRGSKCYIPFPEHLQGRYQSFTEADMSGVRAAGYDADFADVATGVGAYLDWLAQS